MAHPAVDPRMAAMQAPQKEGHGGSLVGIIRNSASYLNEKLISPGKYILAGAALAGTWSLGIPYALAAAATTYVGINMLTKGTEITYDSVAAAVNSFTHDYLWKKLVLNEGHKNPLARVGNLLLLLPYALKAVVDGRPYGTFEGDYLDVAIDLLKSVIKDPHDKLKGKTKLKLFGLGAGLQALANHFWPGQYNIGGSVGQFGVENLAKPAYNTVTNIF